MTDELVMAAEAAAKNAKRAMALTVLAVMVALVVLAIDNTIKSSIVNEARRMRAMLDEVKALTQEVRDGATQAGTAGKAPGNSVNGSGDVVRDNAAGAVLDQAGGAVEPAPAKRPARPAGGLPRNG